LKGRNQSGKRITNTIISDGSNQTMNISKKDAKELQA
jgi:hypothetical protein